MESRDDGRSARATDERSRHQRHRWRYPLATILLAALFGMPGCAMETEGAVRVIEQSYILNDEGERTDLPSDDQRQAVPGISHPYGAIGRVLGQRTCAATVIAPTKVLTASHCVFNGAPGDTFFQPQFGIETHGEAAWPDISATHIVNGRGWDWNQETQADDWAILTLSANLQELMGSEYQELPTAIQSGSPFVGLVLGYPDKWGNPAVQTGPNVLTGQVCLNESRLSGIFSYCDTSTGNSGGPLFDITKQAVVGVNVTSNYFAKGSKFREVPDSAAGIAASMRGSRLRVFASDPEWERISQRIGNRSNIDNWYNWDTFSDNVGGAREMAATNLEDGREVVWFVNQWGNLWVRWRNSNGSWSSWVSQAVPTSVKDVAATGGQGEPTQLFVLGTNNRLYTTYKVGNSSSNWASWTDLGYVLGANTVTAVRWNGLSVPFVSSYLGVYHTWGNQSSFATLVRPTTQSGTLGNPGGIRTVTAGLLADGRIHLLAMNYLGEIRESIRVNNSYWSDWSVFEGGFPTTAERFTTMTSASRYDGREIIFGISEQREIFHIVQQADGSFPGPWKRFYL